jgi:hypothetical protein
MFKFFFFVLIFASHKLNITSLSFFFYGYSWFLLSMISSDIFRFAKIITGFATFFFFFIGFTLP